MNKYTKIIISVAILAITFFGLAVNSYAAKPSDYGLKEGDLISAIFSDDPDVYILNEYGFKRLFLNPEIFKFYKHLGGFLNVKLVTPEVRDAFITSGLFRDCETNDPKVYGVDINSEDTGKLHWVNVSAENAISEDSEFFKKVFCINNSEFKWYPKGSEFKAVKDVPKYERMKEKETISTEKKIEVNTPLKVEGKVIICHHSSEAPNKFQEITIDASALKAHLEHGDSVGMCPRIVSISQPTSTTFDNFAKCLNENGAVMYGVSECPYCQKQKDLFGSSFQYIKYVECSTNSQLCQDKGITGYPTWILPDANMPNSNKLSGMQDLITLSKYAGCALPEPLPVPMPTPSVAPTSITVVSPNGGEVFQKGIIQLIKWNQVNISKIYIKLRKGNDTYSGPEGVITNVIPSVDGYYKWMIPTTLPDGNDYSVRIIDGNSTGVLDDSNAPFSIVTTASQNHSPKIMSVPTIPVKVQTGQSVNFSWSAQDEDNDNLVWQVSWGDGTGMPGACPTNNLFNGQGWKLNTLYVWKQAGTYTVKVTVSDCKGGTDSQSFTVTVGATTTCTDSDGGKNTSVIGMTSGPEWASGIFVTSQDYCITEGEKEGRLVEFYCAENGQVGSITYGPEDGCSRCSGGTCINAASPSITVIYPNGGETWYMGKTYDILWKSSGVEKVYIAANVYKDGVSVGSFSLGNVSAALGKYSWTPNSNHLLEGNQIKIEVSNTEIPISGISTPETLPSDNSDNYFSIIDSASTIVPTSVKKPDLVITDLIWSTPVSSNKSFTMTITVKNIGEAEKPYKDVVYAISSSLTSPRCIHGGFWSSLMPGESISQTFTFGFCPELEKTNYGLPAGTYEINAIIDYDNVFDESNETNNTLTKILVVGTPSVSQSSILETNNLAAFSRNLTIGSTGDDVKQLQALLVKEVNYSINLITGYFGRITYNAVKKLQAKYNISPVSGYFGEITRKVLSTAIISNQ